MLTCCMNCRKIAESKSPKVVRTKNGRKMCLSKCFVCNSKKSNFFREQKATGICEIPSLGPLLF